MFKALLIEKDEAGYRAAVRELPDDALPPGDVTVKVGFSTVNYKDSLAVTGKAPVVRRFPMVAGIDFAGTVEHSKDERFPAGGSVVLTGWGVGETHWGGLAQKARVKGDWLVALPQGLSPAQTMGIGTAGLTAMLCVMTLEEHGAEPGRGAVLVTGATGGVGSFAVALLKRYGFYVIAATGKGDEGDYLRAIGAAEVIDRAEFEGPAKPLARERWAAAVDTVGGTVLAHVCAGTLYGGTVAACGMAGGLDLPGSVAPFILRGVTLAGIDSAMCPRPRREAAWKRLAAAFDPALFGPVLSTIGLGDVAAYAQRQVEGRTRGRVVVDVDA